MKKLICSKAAVLAAMVLVSAMVVVACTAKATVTRRFDPVTGKVIDETRQETWKLKLPVEIKPGFIPVPIPGISIDPDVSVPGTIQPVEVPGTNPPQPGIILPGQPGKIYPVEPVGGTSSGRPGMAGYTVDFNYDPATRICTTGITPNVPGAPALFLPSDHAWERLDYRTSGNSEVISSSDPSVVAGFMYSRGFVNLGEFGHVVRLRVRDENGQVVATLPIGIYRANFHSHYMPLVNSEVP